MTVLKYASVATMIFLTGIASAQPADPKLTTRAEVKADLYIWKFAKLDELNRGEGPVNTDSIEYRKALATYHSIRASPQYSAAVSTLTRDLGARINFKSTLD